MRILIGTDTYPPAINGAAQFCQRLARGLVERGHDVHVAYPAGPSTTGREVDEDFVNLHQVASFSYPLYESFRVCRPGTIRRAARRAMDDAKPDVVHVQGHFVLSRALLERARARGIGVVATNHMMPQNFFDHVPCPALLRGVAARLLWWDLARVFRKANVVTSPTPKAVDLLGQAAGITAIAVSNGVDIAPYLAAADHARPHADPVILFVGRLDQEKRVDDLLHAMARLPAGVPGRLDVVGDGSLQASWRALAQRLGLGPNRVRFRGFLPESELLAAYGEADIFCMPGVAELQSLATLEAMAAGKPVVAADAMALPHLVHHGDNGYLYCPGNAAQLASRLEELLGDHELRQTMGKHSREIVADHGFAATLDCFEQLYAKVSHF